MKRYLMLLCLVVALLVYGNSAYAQYLNGDIAELIIFNKLLSDAERQAIEGKLMLKYRFTFCKNHFKSILLFKFIYKLM